MAASGVQQLLGKHDVAFLNDLLDVTKKTWETQRFQAHDLTRLAEGMSSLTKDEISSRLKDKNKVSDCLAVAEALKHASTTFSTEQHAKLDTVAADFVSDHLK